MTKYLPAIPTTDRASVRTDPSITQVLDADGRPLESEFKTVQWDPVSAEKAGYDRFMQKEIFEQPRAITDTIGTRVDLSQADIDLDGIVFRREQVEKMSRVTLVACGTAYYASMIGRYMIEQLAGIPCEVDLASEFRYRQPIIDGETLVVAVSQSGETADTLAALREGREQGARILSISNTRDSTIARESDDVLSRRMMVIRRDGPNGELLETPRYDEDVFGAAGH